MLADQGLLSLHDSTSENMRKLEVGGIPGQLSMHMAGMTAHPHPLHTMLLRQFIQLTP